MGQARFVFNMASAVPWVVRDTPAPAPVDSHEERPRAICWRLLSPNNRQLGRSAAVFDDLDACMRAVELFLLGLADAEPLIIRHTGPVRWIWRVIEGNHVVAISGRSFEAEKRALRTLDNFLASAVAASAVPRVRGLPMMHSDPCPNPLPIIERWRVR